jgi:glycosyltransferase involved in cell wall biosynthesis
MKIAIYTICKNEEKHVERWYESSKEADYHILADTGSTDRTVEIARDLGITISSITVSPFRFDEARNLSLDLVPEDADYCIALDVDEILTPGWRQPLEEAFAKGIDRPLYRRIETFNDDGTPANEFNGFKVHRRKGMTWLYPIHEFPHWTEERKEVQQYVTGIEIHHLQDKTKSRSQYLPLLELAVKEKPDSRNLYYLGREYTYNNDYKKAKRTLIRYLKKGFFKQERSSACRMLSKVDPENTEEWLLKATDEYPSRESALALAQYYFEKKMWEECRLVAKLALGYTEKNSDFLCEAWAWTHMGDELIAISSYALQDYETAYEHGKKALEISPNDEKLILSFRLYEKKVKDGNTK